MAKPTDQQISEKMIEVLERIWPFEKYEAGKQINRGTLAVHMAALARWARDEDLEEPKPRKQIGETAVYSDDTFDLAKVDLAVHRLVKKEKGNVIPEYSRYIKHAMALQEYLADWGYCCFELNADYTYVYGARLISSKDHQVEYIVNVTDSPALAICLCALLAYGMKDFKSLRKPPTKEIPHIRSKKKTKKKISR